MDIWEYPTASAKYLKGSLLLQEILLLKKVIL